MCEGAEATEVVDSEGDEEDSGMINICGDGCSAIREFVTCASVMCLGESVCYRRVRQTRSRWCGRWCRRDSDVNCDAAIVGWAA